jgi:hypothetical protein
MWPPVIFNTGGEGGVNWNTDAALPSPAYKRRITQAQSVHEKPLLAELDFESPSHVATCSHTRARNHGVQESSTARGHQAVVGAGRLESRRSGLKAMAGSGGWPEAFQLHCPLRPMDEHLVILHSSKKLNSVA